MTKKQLSERSGRPVRQPCDSGTARPYRAARYRVALVCEEAGTDSYGPIQSSAGAAALFCPCFEGMDREQFVICGLDAKHGVIGINIVSIGSLTLSIVHPREVLKPLILMNAAAWLCAHNHPSGDITPSPEDFALTRRLKETSELIGITLLDHLILAGERMYSFADHGWPA